VTPSGSFFILAILDFSHEFSRHFAHHPPSYQPPSTIHHDVPIDHWCTRRPKPKLTTANNKTNEDPSPSTHHLIWPSMLAKRIAYFLFPSNS
jgi:hypothetical protein